MNINGSLSLNEDLSSVILKGFLTNEEKHNLTLDVGLILKYRRPVDSLALEFLENVTF